MPSKAGGGQIGRHVGELLGGVSRVGQIAHVANIFGNGVGDHAGCIGRFKDVAGQIGARGDAVAT